jgi:hypothetical protein
MSCRRQFHAAARRWTLDAIGSGVLSLGEIKQGFQRTRALLQASLGAAPLPLIGAETYPAAIRYINSITAAVPPFSGVRRTALSHMADCTENLQLGAVGGAGAE